MEIHDPERIVELLDEFEYKKIGGSPLSGKIWEKYGKCRIYVGHHGRDRGYLDYDEESGNWYGHVTGGARTEVDAVLEDVENYTPKH